MRTTILMLCLVGCSFSGGNGDGNDTTDAGIDAMDIDIDAAPSSSAVKVVEVVVSPALLRAGDYGFEVAVTIENELDTTIESVQVTLAFADSSGVDGSGDFDWRDADIREGVLPQPTQIGPESSQSYRFIVDALSTLDGESIAVNVEAAFVAMNMPMSVTPLPDSVSVPVTDPTVIVVDQVLDEVNVLNPQISLREAIGLANAAEDLSRITFDPVVFSDAAPATIVILNANGEMPAIDSDTILDGTGAGVVIRSEPTANALQFYGLVVKSGQVLIRGLTFRDLSRYYPNEILTADNCGSGITHMGGAIRVDDGTVVLDGNIFTDRNVSERNCFASLVHFTGGTNHRIVKNFFTNPTADFVRINAPTIEIRGNMFDPGLQPEKSDDAIFVGDNGNQELWVVGNLIVNQDLSGLLVQGSGAAIHVAHNTIVDCGSGRSAVWRENLRPMTFVNNVYLRSDASGINDPQDDGSSMTILFESSFPEPVCSNCGVATHDGLSDLLDDPVLVNDTGVVQSDFAPAPQSPLIDSGSEAFDRNGRRPGLFNGIMVDRGAIETAPDSTR